MTIKQLETVGKKFHDATKHSPLSVMLDPNYVDGSTQPAAFKSYPHFYRRFRLEENNPVHNFIRLTSAITWEKKYKHDFYQLRVNPSAGALYPTEIYLQIRGIKGLIDGIYHLEVATNSLTLIYELIDDGLESYILPNCLVKGLIFLVSCAYYLLKRGDFSEQAKYLCVNQALARDSAVTLFLTSTYNNYQTAMQTAGWLGQRLYLISNYLGIGCSGIGAYHDDETQEFLGTNKDILYAMAIGR